MYVQSYTFLLSHGAPGKTTVIRFTPEKAGVYDFLCDNFCGSGHEEMNGRIVVKD